MSIFSQPIITRIIVSLVLEIVIIRIEIIVFKDFMTLVKYVQILSLFNEAYYYMNYCALNIHQIFRNSFMRIHEYCSLNVPQILMSSFMRMS